jgi:hypothetical protein
MIFNYKHKYLDEIIECELDYFPADPENGYLTEWMELSSAKVKGVDILDVMCESIVREIEKLALNKDAINTD